MQTAETIQKNIKSRLLEMIESRKELLRHIAFLSSLGVDASSRESTKIYFHRCIEAVTGTYIKNLCKKLTLEYADGTPAEIEVDSDLYKLIDNMPLILRSRFLSDDTTLDDQKVLIDVYLHKVDFEKIASEICEQATQLKDTGRNFIAQRILDRFCLKNLEGHYAPFQKKGRVFCHTWPVNYWDSHTKVREIESISSALNMISHDGGLVFGQAINEYLSAIQDLSSKQERLPSRSVFGKGGHLEIHCFKDKHEFRFSIQTFDAILAFLMINGEADAADKIMKRIAIKEAA